VISERSFVSSFKQCEQLEGVVWRPKVDTTRTPATVSWSKALFDCSADKIERLNAMAKLYDPSNFEDRVKLADLRSKVTSQVISISILVNAIPISLKLIFQIPNYQMDQKFWWLLITGWIFSSLRLAFGLLFEAMVPRWTYASTSTRGSAMNFCYLASIAFLGIGTIAFTSALAHAILTGFTLTE
jgi:hypothetical protein